MIRNQEKVEVIEEKSITIKGKEGKVDTLIYLETDQVGLPRPIRNGGVFSNRNNDITMFSHDTYFERLHTNTIKELEEYDKKMVAEAFRTGDVLIPTTIYFYKDAIDENLSINDFIYTKHYIIGHGANEALSQQKIHENYFYQFNRFLGINKNSKIINTELLKKHHIAVCAACLHAT